MSPGHLHDPDNHNGVITGMRSQVGLRKHHDMLVELSIHKSSGGDGIPVELFQILKDDA